MAAAAAAAVLVAWCNSCLFRTIDRCVFSCAVVDSKKNEVWRTRTHGRQQHVTACH
jgi:hypothetical protein